MKIYRHLEYISIILLLVTATLLLLHMLLSELHEGETKKQLIYEMTGLELTDEQAKYVDVGATLTDVQISMEEASIHFIGE